MQNHERRQLGPGAGVTTDAERLRASQPLAEEQLQSNREDLERLVKQRTADLDIVNEELRAANEELRAEMEQRRDAETLRREAVHRISQVQEEERRRLSRELHDQLGQRCAALLLGLRTLDWDADSRPKRMEDLIALAEQIGGDVHSVAVQLRPTSLEDIGLSGALASYIDFWSKRTGIPAQLHTSGIDDPRLLPEVELALYRIVQEALTNVMKHADAHLVAVVIDRHPHEVRALIEDDGRGFGAEVSDKSPRGLGLVGMNERAAEFDGAVTVESTLGAGTSVLVRIPVR